uniref:Uncharacterized protein n=1 Tax=Knipowitschia caucasica TaxID=637954 RepID=A0AAV2JGG1_KNICA
MALLSRCTQVPLGIFADTFRCARLQWSNASFFPVTLSQFPFQQHSLRRSTPQREEAGENVCADPLPEKSITDNVAHCGVRWSQRSLMQSPGKPTPPAQQQPRREEKVEVC